MWNDAQPSEGQTEAGEALTSMHAKQKGTQYAEPFLRDIFIVRDVQIHDVEEVADPEGQQRQSFICQLVT